MRETELSVKGLVSIKGTRGFKISKFVKANKRTPTHAYTSKEGTRVSERLDG